ncbi:AAA family ATPase [Candidatus Bathyarchaeota archaeon]|nr:AAA family ATPase [Candidatus Bathyarchaeota archaeon]
MVDSRRTKSWRRKGCGEDYQPPPEAQEKAPLPPEAEAARNTITLSLIEPIGRRAAAVFLGHEDYEKLRGTYSFLMASLYMEALPRLVEELGGHVVMAMQFNGVALNAVYDRVTLDGKDRQFALVGHIFICLPGERVVVSAEPAEPAARPALHLTVRSSLSPGAFLNLWRTFTREHNYLRGRAFFADGTLIERKHRFTWDDILLAEDVKLAVKTHVDGFLRHRVCLARLGVKSHRGLILEGPPGTGKTLLGKVLASTMEDTSFVWVSPRHIEGPRSFEDILEVARFVSPAVVFLEDLDLFAEDRDVRGGMVLGELMNQLDGAAENDGIITIATTNRLGVVEKALRNRPGRFDRVLHVAEMEERCRRLLIERLLAKARISPEDVSRLVSASDGYTGAQVEELVNTLYILAVNRHGYASGNGDGQPSVTIDSPLIAAALEEFKVELKARVGFHRA